MPKQKITPTPKQDRTERDLFLETPLGIAYRNITEGLALLRPLSPEQADSVSGVATDTKTLAEELGVKAWHELEAKWTLEGVRWKRKGASGHWRMLTWQDMRLDRAEKQRHILMALSEAGTAGIANKYAKNKKEAASYRKTVERLNGTLCEIMGLEDLPIANIGGTRTQCKFPITMDPSEIRPQPNTVSLLPEEEDKSKDRWSPCYEGPESGA